MRLIKINKKTSKNVCRRGKGSVHTTLYSRADSEWECDAKKMVVTLPKNMVEDNVTYSCASR